MKNQSVDEDVPMNEVPTTTTRFCAAAAATVLASSGERTTNTSGSCPPGMSSLRGLTGSGREIVQIGK